MLLLDTHVWLWCMQRDSRRIGRRTRQLLYQAESQDAIRISPVSLFEVAALHTLGRIRLTRPAEQWIDESLEAPGVRLAELTPVMAIAAGQIPRTALADPLDRLLVATAQHLGATFLTSDARILDHAAGSGSLSVHNAGR